MEHVLVNLLKSKNVTRNHAQFIVNGMTGRMVHVPRHVEVAWKQIQEPRRSRKNMGEMNALELQVLK